jgi:hypothetical protein
VVPLIWAGAWRASSIVASVLPATPTPVVLRKLRRLNPFESVDVMRTSLMGGPPGVKGTKG